MPVRVLALLLVALCLPLCAQTTAQLLRQLNDPDPTVQVAAVQALGQQRGREAVEPLIALCRTGSPTLRGQVAAALGRIGDKRATPALSRLLRDPFILVRMAAVAALGELRDPEAVPALLDALRNADSGIHVDAIAILGKLGDARATPELLKLLDAPDPAVRDAAFAALSATRDPRAAEAFLPGLKRVEPEIRLASARALIPLRYPPAREPLLAALRDYSTPVRVAAADALSTYRDPRNADALLEAMADDEDAVRAACLKALLPLCDPRVLEPCLKILDDAPYNDDTALTLAAVDAASRLRDARAVPLLLPLLTDRHYHEHDDGTGYTVQEHAYAALRRIGTPALIALLAESAGDVERKRRQQAILALGRWQSPRATAHLLAMLSDSDSSVQQAVIEALTIEHSGQTFYILWNHVMPPRERIAFAASWPAPRAWCRDPRLIERLAADVETGNAGMLHPLKRMGTPRALEAVLKEAKHPQPHRRRQAAAFLQYFDDPRAADALITLLLSKESGRDTAWQGLMSMPASLPQARLVAALTHKDVQVRKWVIAILGTQRDARAVPALLKVVGADPDPQVREYCALALGMIGDNRAVPALLNRLNDPVEWARSAAAWALGQIGDPRAIEPLKKKATGADARFAVRIGRSLAQLGDPRGAELLAVALDYPDGTVRVIAAASLHDLPDTVALPLLLGLLEKHEAERYQVLVTLQRMRDPAVAELLMPLLRHQDDSIAVNAAWALARMGADAAREPLAACLETADGLRVDAVAGALACLGDARGLPRALDILADPVAVDIRLELLLALGERPGAFPEGSDDQASLREALGALLTDTDPLIVGLAARALHHGGDPRGAKALLDLFAREDDPALLRFIVPWLAETRDPRAVAPLQAHLPKTAFPVRLQIVEALGVIGDPTALPMLANLSQHLNPLVREATARGLANQGEAARHLLTPLQNDEASRVRKAAEESLKRIDGR